MKAVRFVVFILSLFLLMPVVNAEVSVSINDRELLFDDQPPVVIDNRTFVPLRKIFEELGASVDWIAETNTVYASKRFNVLTLTLGEEVYYLNGEEKRLDVPAFSQNGRTLIPARAVSEAFGAEVVWDRSENKVKILLNDGQFEIIDRYTDGAEKADDGTVIMTYRAAYPEIQSDDKISAAFNEFIKADAEDASKKAVLECLQLAKDSYNDSFANGYEFIPFMAEHSFDITYNNNDIISVLCSDCNFSGGVHPNYTMYSMTYSMNTGKMIEISELLNKNESAVRKEVYSLFKADIEENSQIYYADALDCLDDALERLNWYLADDGVHFYLNPYEIAPYAAGVRDVVISL